MAFEQSIEVSEALCVGDEHLDDDGRLRTGSLWTCIAHIITAVIGSGVLSLAWSTTQLGWIVGPVSLLCFAVVTYVSVFLLSDCYRSPHPVIGARNYSYIDLVTVNLGEKQAWVCGLLQYLSMYGTGIAYNITTPTRMRAIQRSGCYHKEGHGFLLVWSYFLHIVIWSYSDIFIADSRFS